MSSRKIQIFRQNSREIRMFSSENMVFQTKNRRFCMNRQVLTKERKWIKCSFNRKKSLKI